MLTGIVVGEIGVGFTLGTSVVAELTLGGLMVICEVTAGVVAAAVCAGAATAVFVATAEL